METILTGRRFQCTSNLIRLSLWFAFAFDFIQLRNTEPSAGRVEKAIYTNSSRVALAMMWIFPEKINGVVQNRFYPIVLPNYSTRFASISSLASVKSV
jgi:hypothetical protein